MDYGRYFFFFRFRLIFESRATSNIEQSLIQMCVSRLLNITEIWFSRFWYVYFQFPIFFNFIDAKNIVHKISHAFTWNRKKKFSEREKIEQKKKYWNRNVAKFNNTIFVEPLCLNVADAYAFSFYLSRCTISCFFLFLFVTFFRLFLFIVFITLTCLWRI